MSTAASKVCPRCRAQLPADAASCWLCGLELSSPFPRSAVSHSASDLVEDVQVVGEAGPTFSLATLFLLITLFALCFGLFAVAPGLSILLAIATLPAFLRTLLVSYHRGKLGRAVSPGQKVLLFFASIATIVMMAVVVFVAAIGSLFVICLTALIDPSVPWAKMIGLGTAVCVGVLLLVLIWARYKYDVNKA